MGFYHQTKQITMQFMIIERFKDGKIKALYERFDHLGRLLPEEVNYIDSWISQDLRCCYQLMEAPSEIKIKEWISRWDDLAEFTFTTVISSTEAKKRILNGASSDRV